MHKNNIDIFGVNTPKKKWATWYNNEYKSPGYYLFSIYSHRDINLPIIRFQHPIERGHYFWSNCSHYFDQYRLISIVCVPNRHDTPQHQADLVAIPAFPLPLPSLIDTVAYHNRTPAEEREKKANVKRIKCKKVLRLNQKHLQVNWKQCG